MNNLQLRLPEITVPGKRLGRHIGHDPRSLAYLVPETSTPATVQWDARIPVLDQGDLGSCFPPGTRVRMADGSERPIEDVRLGERVLTAEGNTGRVVRTLLRDQADGLVNLRLWGHRHLRMTREHPILTSDGYVPAYELPIGAEVALPRFIGQGVTAIPTADLITEPAHRLVRGNRWSGVQGRQGLKAGANALPEKIELTPGVGRLIGLFLAEGSCDASKARWTFGAHEVDTLVAEAVQLLADEWLVSAHVALRANNSVNVTIHGKAWSRLLHALCGNGAGRKGLSPLLTQGGVAFLEAVLFGWLDGDGHRRPDGSQEGVTISRDLALGMYDIAQGLGLHPVIDHREAPQNSAAKVRQPRWTVTLAPGKGRCRQDDKHVWRKVTDLAIEPYVGPVYDLTVEGDHSYVAEGVGVHNCTGNATTGELGTTPFFDTLPHGTVLDEGFAVTLYEAATRLDSYPGAYKPTDTGSDGLSAAKAAKQLGLASGYVHATSLAGLHSMIASGPFAIGVSWYSDMDDPDSNGVVKVGGTVRGGHELCVVGYDSSSNLWRVRNSWGDSWGRGGFCFWSDTDMAKLLAEQGDATQLVPITQPAPTPTPVPTPVPPAPQPTDPTYVAWMRDVDPAYELWKAHPIRGRRDLQARVEAWKTNVQ